MTTMQIDRAVVEQALEVINDTAYGAPVFRQEVRDTITALRAALAQPDPQDPELSAALGWPGGISDPVLDRKTLLQQVAALRAALAQQKDPTDPGNEVDVLREHVRHLERRVRELHAQKPEPAPTWKPAEWKRGCAVCGIGADGRAYAYVCSRSDCPTKVTCGGVA